MRPITNVTFDMIEERNKALMLVSGLTGVACDDIMGKSHKERIAIARQLVCWYLADLHDLPVLKIGVLLHRTHGTVIYGRNMIRRALQIGRPKNLCDIAMTLKAIYEKGGAQ